MGSCNICKLNHVLYGWPLFPSPSSSSKNGHPVFSLPSRYVDCDLDAQNIQATPATSSQHRKFYRTWESRKHSCQRGQQESACLHIIFLSLSREILLSIRLHNTTLFYTTILVAVVQIRRAHYIGEKQFLSLSRLPFGGTT